MKIKNHDGRSWISKYDNSGLTIHITNAEVKEVELKGSMLVITLGEEKNERINPKRIS